MTSSSLTGAPPFIVTALVTEEGNLALLMSDDRVIVAGRVIGPDGEKGDRGMPGVKGPAGQDGNTLLTVDGIPQASDGTEGDWAINKRAMKIYGPKVASGWGKGTDMIMTASSIDAAAKQLIGKIGGVGGSPAAQQSTLNLTALNDVTRHSSPALGQVPIWTYVAGQSAHEGFWNFAAPAAHLKNWESVVHWESGATVFYHGVLWRATRDNTAVEPKLEDGRTQLYIHVPGEPTFGILPTSITTAPPPAGLHPVIFKFGYWLQYTDDHHMVIWKHILKGKDPVTGKVIGEWEARPWTCMAWRSMVPPPSMVPPGTVQVWIYGDPTSTSAPITGQQEWASIELKHYLSQAADVSYTTPKNGDLLTYNATINKWELISRAELATSIAALMAPHTHP